MPILGSGSYPTATELDSDDRVVALVDGAVTEVPGSVAKSFMWPDDMVDVNDYGTLAGSLIDACEATTNFALEFASVSEVLHANATFGATQGTNAVWTKLSMRDGQMGKLYLNFPTPLAIGSHTLVAFDVEWGIDGPTTSVPDEFVCEVADGTALVNGNVNTVSFPSIPALTWTTVVLPLSGLSAIKSIGCRRAYPSSSGRALPTNWRALVAIDNIRFIDETKLDQALGSSSTAAVVVPATYTPSASQTPTFLPAGKGIIDLSRGVFSNHNKVVYLHDYLAHIPGAETGETDVAAAVNGIINDATPGQIVRGSPGATYRFDNGMVLTADYVEVDFTGCTLMLTFQQNVDFCLIKANHLRVRGGLWLGYGRKNQFGSNFLTLAGSPTNSGTTKLLDAQDEEVKSSTHTNWAKGSHFARHLPQQLGLADDGLGPRWYIEFQLSDSAQVANDCTISILDDTTLEVLKTQTLTLTGTPTFYRLEAFPSELLTRLRFTVKKNTATANTITLTSAWYYGENEYLSTYDTAACIGLENSYYIDLFDIHAEGFGGDAIQVSNANVHHIHVDGVTSWGCRRQGMSFNQGTDFLIENCEIYACGRSAIDFEPYAADWFTQRVTVRNIYMDEITNYGFAMANWARNYDYVINGVVLAKSRFGMIYGGFQRGVFTNCVNRWPGSTYDYEFLGSDMLISECASVAGIRCYDETSDSDVGDGAGVVVYTPINNVLSNIRISPASVNAKMVHVDLNGGYRLDNIRISQKQQATFTNVGQIGMYQRGAYNGIDFGELARQLPNYYKGLAFSDVWVPDGINSHDDPMYGIRGISGSTTTRSNNLRAIATAVTASATTLAVAFPTRNVGALSAASTASGNAAAGSLTPSTTYYYRIAPRKRFAGPGVYLSQFSVTTNGSQTSVGVAALGFRDIPNGMMIEGFTLLRGTTNGGPYTTRYDVFTSVPGTHVGGSGVTCIDTGTTLSTPSVTGFDGSPFAAQTGSWTATVNESGWEPDASYGVWVSTNWLSGHPYVTSKAVSGFTINFPTAAPGDGSGRVDWALIR